MFNNFCIKTEPVEVLKEPLMSMADHNAIYIKEEPSEEAEQRRIKDEEDISIKDESGGSNGERSLPLTWTREHTDLLISLYKAEPSLWNAKENSYKNRTKRSVALSNIKNKLRNVNGASKEEIRKKIHVLRSQFCVERRKINASRKSCSDIESRYRTKLWCYKKLLFLDNSIVERLPTSSLADFDKSYSQVEEEDENMTLSISNSFDGDYFHTVTIPSRPSPKEDLFTVAHSENMEQVPFNAILPDTSADLTPSNTDLSSFSAEESASATPTPSFPPTTTSEEPIKPKKRRKCPDESEELLSVIKKNLCEEDDDIISWSKGVGLQLKKTNKLQCTIAKKVINDVIYYAEMGMLTTDVALSNLKKFE